MNKTREYHAFISYRHADNKGQGRQWATWLHQAIETYEVPEELVGRTNGRGEEIPARIYPIFRDEEELPANADLGGSIVNALDSTRLLIVLCSPRAVASTYVADEIDYFKMRGGSNRIIAAIIDGEPNASVDEGKLANGFAKEDECFPQPLQYEYDAQGQQTSKRAEPIAADFRINNDGRAEQGWTTPAAYRLHLKADTSLDGREIEQRIATYRQQQQLMLLKIIAGIIGVPLGELTQRDKAHQLQQAQQKARRLRRWLGAVASLAVLAALFGWFAYENSIEAEKQRALAEHQRTIAVEEKDRALLQESRFLYKSAEEALQNNNVDLALHLAARGLPEDMSHPQRPLFLPLQDLVGSVYYDQGRRITLAGHRDEVQLAVFSPDGRFAATASADHTARIWDVASGTELAVLHHDEEVTSLDFSPDGSMLVTGAADHLVRIWDLERAEVRATMQGHEWRVVAVKFTPDGSRIVSSDNSSDLLVWDTASESLLHTLRHNDSVMQFLISRDGHRILTEDRGLNELYSRLWDLDSGKQLSNIKHAHTEVALALAPTGDLLALAGNKGVINLIDPSSGKHLATLMADATTGKMVFGPDSKTLLIASEESDAQLWDISSARLLTTLVDSKGITLEDISFSGGGDYVAASAWHLDKVVIWHLEDGSREGNLLHEGGVRTVRFNAAGDRLISASADHTARIWEVSRDPVISRTHVLSSGRVTFSPDSRLMLQATGIGMSGDFDADYAARRPPVLREVVSGDKLLELPYLPQDMIDGHRVMAFDSAGERVIISLGNDETAYIFDVKGEDEPVELKHDGYIHAVSFARHADLALTAAGYDAVIWDLQSLQPLHTFTHQELLRDALLYPAGDRLATSDSEGRVYIWDVVTNKILQTFEYKDGVEMIALSHSGELLATLVGEAITVRDARSGNVMRVIDLDGQSADSLHFSPDDRRIIAAARLYDLSTGLELKRSHPGYRDGLYSPDGSYMAIVDHDLNEIQIRGGLFNNPAVVARVLIQRELTDDERRSYYMPQQVGANPEAVNANYSSCDRLASDPYDPQHEAPGVAYLEAYDLSDAIYECRAAVEASPANARFRYQLGRLLEAADGLGDGGLSHYTAAAEAGYPAAKYALGRIGVSGGTAQLIAWLEEAFEAGVARAGYELGHRYWYGVDVAADRTAALEYFLHAARAGDPFSYLRLGELYAMGSGVERDSKNALYSYLRAERLFSDAGDKEMARICRQRSASLAYSVAANDVVTAWQRANE